MKKSTVRILVGVIVVCLAISLGYVLLNRTTSREATVEEIAASEAYVVDWKAIPGWEAGMTEKGFILTLCSYDRDEEIGSNVHKLYTSEILGDHLYRCHELSEITVMNETLYITYFAEDGDMVILAYTDEGLNEKGIYDAETDTMFHEIDGTAVVWNKFRSGFQWGG